MSEQDRNAGSGAERVRKESVVGIVGVRAGGPSSKRHRIPAVVFGVWCAHPGSGDMWRVSHGPTGKALFCAHADVDWWTAIRIAEELHCEFGDAMPNAGQAKTLIEAVMRLGDCFIESTDWTS